MANPNLKNDPDTYLGTHWITSKTDNFGVHTNSGVQNFWFYLLSVGGSGTNDNSNAYSVTGLGMSKAVQIAYRNLSVYLTPTSNYAMARQFAIQSARDLYGNCSNEVTQTTAAWYAVGVGTNVGTTGSSIHLHLHVRTTFQLTFIIPHQQYNRLTGILEMEPTRQVITQHIHTLNPELIM
jgi:hypothetical protein